MVLLPWGRSISAPAWAALLVAALWLLLSSSASATPLALTGSPQSPLLEGRGEVYHIRSGSREDAAARRSDRDDDEDNDNDNDDDDDSGSSSAIIVARGQTTTSSGGIRSRRRRRSPGGRLHGILPWSAARATVPPGGIMSSDDAWRHLRTPALGDDYYAVVFTGSAAPAIEPGDLKPLQTQSRRKMRAFVQVLPRRDEKFEKGGLGRGIFRRDGDGAEDEDKDEGNEDGEEDDSKAMPGYGDRRAKLKHLGMSYKDVQTLWLVAGKSAGTERVIGDMWKRLRKEFSKGGAVFPRQHSTGSMRVDSDTGVIVTPSQPKPEMYKAK